MLSILIVDDCSFVRCALRVVLGASATLEVLEAADGIEALRVLASTPVDWVASDIEMPRMDGFALVAALRAQLTVPRVILHTTEPARYLAAAEAAGVPIVAKTDLVSAICAAVPIR